MPKKFLKKATAAAERVKRTELPRLERLFRARWVAIVSVGFMTLVIAMLTTMSVQRLPSELFEGAIASRDIKADRNYEIIDEEATQSSREEAERAVLSIYDFDDELADQVAARIEKTFAAARDELNALRAAQPKKRKKTKAAPELTKKQVNTLRTQFHNELGVEPNDAAWALFMQDGFSERMGKTVAYLVGQTMAKPIVAERMALTTDKGKGITIRRMRKQDGDIVVDKEWHVDDPDTVLSTDEARERIDLLADKRNLFKDPAQGKVIIAFAETLVEPNLAFDRAETDLRRKEAARNVKSSIIRIKVGEMIVRDGARYEKYHIKVLSGIQREKQKGSFSREFIGTWLIAFLILIIPFYLARHFMPHFHPSRRDYFLMGVTGFTILGIMRLMIVILPAVREALFPQVPIAALSYIIPVAGGVMLVRMVLSAEITLVFAVIMSMLSALFIQTDLQFTSYVLLSSLAAMIAIANVDRRTLIIRAGLLAGTANLVIALGIRLMGMVTVTEAVTTTGMLWCATFAFLGGVGAAVFVMITVPIIESVLNYTTDIKLLELANLNHPLLRELIVTAPGTYHHAHLVGILGEAAAEAIGANALLVRVGAYYHDIGKMRKPQYFIENARNSESRHDKLTPHMSALIVQAHVKEGIDMAKAARLPKVIIDMIPQHHGTRMISFFYEKAKEKEDPERQKIDAKDFRYLGPKPQTREAAILMLSDVAEAQVRALKEKSPARIEQTVRKIIDDVFREAQLDECELTLKDLDGIHKAFVRILLGIYHQRIEYPDKDKEKEKGEKGRENLGGGTETASASSDEDSLSVGIRGTSFANGSKKPERNDR